MIDNLFIGRQRELDRLLEAARRTAQGQGQVVFIAGEPGSGKTALLREFGRRAQQLNEELVLAIGECNAQAGIGDAYLPFRDILNLLEVSDGWGHLKFGVNWDGNQHAYDATVDLAPVPEA